MFFGFWRAFAAKHGSLLNLPRQKQYLNGRAAALQRSQPTLWASAQHLGSCDGQAKPGKEYVGRLEEHENPPLHVVSWLRHGYGGVSLKASLSLSVLGGCETSAPPLSDPQHGFLWET